MRDLHLARTIPLVGLGALVLVGCGGRTIDEMGESGSYDPLSDDNFEDTLLDSFEDFCIKQDSCGYNSEFDEASDCAEYYYYNLDRSLDLDSRACRQRALDVLDCVTEQSSCDYNPGDLCGDELYELIENCADNYYDYNYDDYYYDY